MLEFIDFVSANEIENNLPSEYWESGVCWKMLEYVV